MLVLFETPAGYAVFKYLDESKLSKVDKIWEEFETSGKALEHIQLVDFKSFKSVDDAVEAVTSVVEGKLPKTLKKLLKKQSEKVESLAVGDVKLANIIKGKFDNLTCLSNSATAELMRGIRANMDELLAEHNAEINAMRLAMAHALARYRVKFNPEKLDTMIVQAVSLLDDLDKELNNYAMRLREWYGWHFPELSRLITEHMVYAKVVKAIGMKQNALKAKLDDVVPEELEHKIKEEAEMSMGTDITDIDLISIRMLCDEVIEMSKYRIQLYDYLKNRMHALAPNLTVLLGELVGARMILRAGSLVNLAKLPSSTVQILGAEKALFRALKTKKNTPKYGLIYHAQLISQTTTRLKGKIARKLAAKVSLSTRVDALCDESLGNAMGIEQRALMEKVVKEEQERPPKRFSGHKQAPHSSYNYKKEAYQYDERQDFTVGKKRKFPEHDEDQSQQKKAKKPKSSQELPAVDKMEVEEEHEEPASTNQPAAAADEEETEDVPLKTPEKKKKKKKHVAE